MTRKELSAQDHEFLEFVYDYRNKLSLYPDNLTLQEALKLTRNGVSTRAKKLRDKGLLSKDRGQYIPTPEADRIMTQSRVMIPFYLRVLGQVKAGRAIADDLRIDMNDPNDMEASTIAIPGDYVGSDVYALEVTGNSMIGYGIYPGSYVIVRQGVFGRILVTRYLAPCDENLFFDQEITKSTEGFEAPLIPIEWLHGPTVKYYLGQDDSGYHLLQGKEEKDSKRSIIKTRYIQPVGAVIGVYRVVT